MATIEQIDIPGLLRLEMKKTAGCLGKATTGPAPSEGRAAVFVSVGYRLLRARLNIGRRAPGNRNTAAEGSGIGKTTESHSTPEPMASWNWSLTRWTNACFTLFIFWALSQVLDLLRVENRKVTGVAGGPMAYGLYLMNRKGNNPENIDEFE